jgi:hypothetical protein
MLKSMQFLVLWQVDCTVAPPPGVDGVDNVG